jgi:uncharacterized delta-60 repeat protein
MELRGITPNLARRVAGASFVGLLLLAGMPRVAAQQTWAVEASGTSQDLWGVCYGEQTLVAVGTGGTILTSNNGISWNQQPSGTTNWLLAVAYGQGEFVAVGDVGTILYSSYGNTWNQVTVGGARLNGVAYGREIWLAVGEGGAVARSSDGVHWTAGNAGVSGWLRGVVYRYDQSQFIVTGEGGTLLSTPDGITFTPIVSGTAADIECIATGGVPLQDVAAGANGTIIDSQDGLKWTATGPQGGAHFRGCSIVGNTGFFVGTAGTILSADLVQMNWQEAAIVTGAGLYSVASGSFYTGNFVVAVGQGGVILGTQVLLPAVSAIIGSTQAPALGGSVEIAVTATGQTPFTYQWYFNEVAIPGAIGPTLLLSQLQASQNGVYIVSVSDSLGSASTSYVLNATYQAVIPGLVDESYDPVLDLPSIISTGEGDLLVTMPAAAAIQPDGRLIIASPSLVRINTDGTLDASFNPAPFGNVTSVFVQPDGKILAATYDTGGLIGRSPSVASVRLNPDGTLDPSYTPHVVPAGVVLTEDAIPQITLADGRYLASQDGLIVRLTVNGAIDPTFTATSPAGSFFVLDPAGRVIVGSQNSIFRLNPDGTPDPSFAPATEPGTTAGVYLQATGRIVYLFKSTVPSTLGALMVGRLNADGSPDPTYPGLSLPTATGPQWVIGASTMTPDGSLWLDVTPDAPASASSPLPIIDGTYRSGVIRIDPNGSFDPTYALNVEGAQLTSLSLTNYSASVGPAAITGILQAPDGQWYVWGNFAAFDGEPRTGIARINPQVGAQFSKLGNLSARTVAGEGPQTLIVGFVTQGPGGIPMLLRGVGPGLAAFGVTGYLADPKLSLFDQSGDLQLSDDNWGDNGNGPAIAAAAVQVGAFPLANGSLDAAALATLGPGSHTFQVFGSGGASGIALAEAYDANPAAPSFSGPRAINFSCRSQAGSGSNALIGGFVIEGANAKRVLIRAVGPSLASFGVAGVLPDPVLTLYSGSVAIGSSGPGWAADPTLQATFDYVGAFGLATGSQDTAMTLTLSPGAYTAQVTSQSGASGVALVEVYEVP